MPSRDAAWRHRLRIEWEIAREWLAIKIAPWAVYSDIRELHEGWRKHGR